MSKTLLRLELKGFEATLRALGKAKAAIKTGIAEALDKCGHVILNRSQIYVPVDTGALKASGGVETEGTGKGARTRVFYDTFYAVYVHEITTAYHEPPTGAKYLDRAVKETRGACASIVRREIEIAKSAY